MGESFTTVIVILYACVTGSQNALFVLSFQQNMVCKETF